MSFCLILSSNSPNKGLLLNGYDPNGVEEIGNFGDGLLKAVNQFKKDKNITVNNLAGAMTFKALVV